MSETLLDIFEMQVARSGRRTALRYRSGGLWRGRTWEEWARTAHEIAAALTCCAVDAGDRVAILAQTRLAWVEADIGILHAGAATVAIYPTLLPDAIGQILRDSGARVVFADDPTQLRKLFDPRCGPLPALEHAVVFDRVSRLSRPDEKGRLDVALADVLPEAGSLKVSTLDEMLAVGRDVLVRQPELLAERRRQVRPDSLAALLYTSGTTGEPKGVMLTHDNFAFETETLRRSMPVGVTDEQLLFLPLAHIVAKLTVMLQLRVGYVTAFAEGIEQAVDDCEEVRPTFIVGVPRVYEKIQEAVLVSVERGGDVRHRVFDWAMDVGRRVSALRQNGREPTGVLALSHRGAERSVFLRIKNRLGGRVRFMLSGAAPLAKATAEFFHAVGLLILEGYGLTESTGASTLNLPSRYRFGTVGPALAGVDVRVASDGEILLRGRSIMTGYWRSPESSAEVLDAEGWLHTGDVGTIDAGGFLEITDRKKDLIITAGGKNIAPQRVEQLLLRSRYIARAIVLGDRRKYPIALVVPATEALINWADRNGLGGDLAALVRHPRVRDLLSAEVELANQELASYEQVKRFEVLDRDLSAEAGELTPTQKIRRRAVEAHFGELIDSLYEGLTGELDDIA